MWSIIVKGGIIMVPLGICSVLALYIIIERGIYFLNYKEDGRDLARRLKSLLAEGRWDEAEKLVSMHPEDSYVRIAAQSLKDKESIIRGDEGAVQSIAQDELNQYQRGLALLDTIVTAAPMLGLLGTVTGIISSFQILAATVGQATAQSISQGIAEALITTATGLFIAIPSLFFLNGYQRRIESEAQKLTQFAQSLIELIRGGGSRETAN